MRTAESILKDNENLAKAGEIPEPEYERGNMQGTVGPTETISHSFFTAGMRFAKTYGCSRKIAIDFEDMANDKSLLPVSFVFNTNEAIPITSPSPLIIGEPLSP